MGRRNCIVTRIVCLERGGINNDLGEKVLIFIYDFGMCLVFVVEKVRKKTVPFCWGRCGRSDVVLPLPAKLQFFSLDSVRLLMISLETRQWHLGWNVSK